MNCSCIFKLSYMHQSLKKCFLVLFSGLSILLNAQDFTPVVNQFTKNDYHASNQNWSVGQSADGILYFGNNKGLLEFDGSLWTTHAMPENKMVRSLQVIGKRIYVGSFEEFGYYERNENGELIYTSLSSKLNGYKMQNDEIWNIIDYNGTIIFQSFTSYFSFKNGKISGVRCPYTFLFFNIFKNKIYTHTEQYGFSYFDLNSSTFVPITNSILKSPVVVVLNYDKERAILLTKSDGLFLFDGTTITSFKTDADVELRKAEINRAIQMPDGTIVIGTILNGITAITPQGKKLWTLNTSNVLQNNTVLGMTYDSEQNLWLALDKGISLLRLNSAFSYIHSFTPSVGSIYSVSYQAPNLLIGTNQGLYTAQLSDDKKQLRNLHLEPNIKGQVWNVQKFDNQQLCGNNEETFEVSEKGAGIISPVRGGICIKRGVIHGKEVLVQGTYTQLCVYEKVNNRWAFSHTVDGFVNPIRYIEIDYTGTIWASHLHQGLYAIQLSPDLRKIEKMTTFNSLDNKNNYPINVFSINNRVVFTDNTAFYTYDDIRKKLIRYDELNKSLGYFASSYRVCHFKSDLYWFIRDMESALVQVKPGGIKLLDVVHYAMFPNQTVDDYQNIVPISAEACLFTLENGLVLYQNTPKHAPIKKGELRLKMVQTSDAKSSKYYYLPLSNEQTASTPYLLNNVSFTVFFPQYSNLNNISYQYLLEGFDKVWSDPSEFSHKEYRFLPHGEYTFRCKVLTMSGILLSETSYKLVVEPPFYLSLIAEIFYFILILLSAVGLYLYIQHNFRKKKEKIHQEQEQIRLHEIEKREQQILTLQTEKLESELTVKSKELAVSTMTIIKKNEILVSIKEELINQKTALGSQYPNKYYDKLIRLLDDNLSSEDDWAIFQTNFDRIHENFFRNLHITYPEFTSTDLRFCAYLRLNLSSKDIAHLMNISLKGVEMARSRIRKKIGIPSSKSLTEFMIEFK